MSFSLVEMLTFSNFSFIRPKRQTYRNGLNLRITQRREAAMHSIQTYNASRHSYRFGQDRFDM
jgi:hypothetical protein